MIHFSVPNWVSGILKKPLLVSDYSEVEIALLRMKLARFNNEHPLVSVVIPAWNEEACILHTLHSLANTNTQFATELIVVDNNSTDGTAALLQLLGVKTISEKKQGVGNARTCGLHQAKGKYILTGDSDTLYPPGWITAMTKTLIDGENIPVYCVHGRYSFLPSAKSPRWQYAFYEMLTSIVINRKEKKQPYLNTYGFNCGFVKQKGIDVNGYDIETQRTFRGNAGGVDGHAAEDGMMALRLMNAGGKIKAIVSLDGRAWTSDRRLQIDGGLKSSLLIRIKKYLFKHKDPALCLSH